HAGNALRNAGHQDEGPSGTATPWRFGGIAYDATPRTAMRMSLSALLFLLMIWAASPALAADAPGAPEILTPPPPATPRINGPRVYGQRPGRPFLYTIPATGEEPMLFSATGLPRGLWFDPTRG